MKDIIESFWSVVVELFILLWPLVFIIAFLGIGLILSTYLDEK